MTCQLAEIHIEGAVQGVGFRPHVWQLAQALSLQGEVFNDGSGVQILLYPTELLLPFIKQLKATLPAPGEIDKLSWHFKKVTTAPLSFEITKSICSPVQTRILPDIATCDACYKELFDPHNRRYHHPFINCTHCGPRYSIIKQLPYDRKATSMATFELCPECQNEYTDPNNRRFHAQPNACPECGPILWLESGDGNTLETKHPIKEAASLLKQGKILAIKGIGGFHLACDASNETAIGQLRKGKDRPHKPLAILVRDLEQLKDYALVSKQEAEQLQSAAAPIVLVKKALLKANLVKNCLIKKLANNLSPNNVYLGAMLASNPLQHLLMSYCDMPLVMTSGNRGGDAPCTSNHQARSKLAPWLDALLLHNRQIVNRVDDSVLQVSLPLQPLLSQALASKQESQVQVLRRARGYAPTPINLPLGFEQADSLLALGGDLKCSPCLLKKGKAFLLPYIGDLKSEQIQQDLLSSIKRFEQLMEITIRHLALDSHPNYISARLAKQHWPALCTNEPNSAQSCSLVQHHHAHLAACLAEHAYPLNGPKVLGLILDGSGYADSNSPHPIWGGELLLADYRSCQHLDGLPAIALAGAEQAVREPWRNLLAYLERYIPHWQSLDLPVLTRLQKKPINTLRGMINNKINAPLASSCGRLFDAVAALLELSFDTTSFEGQAAIALESLAAELPINSQPQNVAIADSSKQAMHILWQGLLSTLEQQGNKAQIAADFHQGLSQILSQLVLRQAKKLGCNTLVLSGGCIQNRRLCTLLSQALTNENIKVMLPQQIPANDGGIALGQTLIAWARLKAKAEAKQGEC